MPADDRRGHQGRTHCSRVAKAWYTAAAAASTLTAMYFLVPHAIALQTRVIGATGEVGEGVTRAQKAGAVREGVP